MPASASRSRATSNVCSTTSIRTQRTGYTIGSPGGSSTGAGRTLSPFPTSATRSSVDRHRPGGVRVRTQVFKLKADEIKPLAPGRGSCIATDLITVGGEKVGYMYREDPDPENAAGSGWRFFSGTVEDEYANDPDNLQVYDVNTIANYDPEIIPFL